MIKREDYPKLFITVSHIEGDCGLAVCDEDRDIRIDIYPPIPSRTDEPLHAGPTVFLFSSGPLTPTKAREYAALLEAAADHADTLGATVSEPRGPSVDVPENGPASEPKCLCFAPPSDQHLTWCPREGMDFDPPVATDEYTRGAQAAYKTVEDLPVAVTMMHEHATGALYFKDDVLAAIRALLPTVRPEEENQDSGTPKP